MKGYRCEEHNNPADFFLDIVNGDASKYDVIIDRTEQKSETDEEYCEMARMLNEKYSSSDANKKMKKNLKRFVNVSL